MGVVTRYEPESIPVVFKNGSRRAFTQPLYRYDYGQKLRFIGIDLPQTFTVQFSNTEELGTATSAIGQDREVAIPNEYLRHSWEHIFAFIFMSVPGHGNTVWEAVIPVINRPGLSDPSPSPIEDSVIQQAITVLNNAVNKVDTVMEDVEAAAETLERAAELIDGFEQGGFIIDGGDADSICGGEDFG